MAHLQLWPVAAALGGSSSVVSATSTHGASIACTADGLLHWVPTSGTDSPCLGDKPARTAAYAVNLLVPGQAPEQMSQPMAALSLLPSGGVLFAHQGSCRLLFCQLPAEPAPQQRQHPGPADIFHIGSHEAPITCITASPCSSLALSGDKGGNLSLWSLSSGAQLAAAQGGKSRGALAAACWLQATAEAATPALLLVTAQQGCSAVRLWRAEGRAGGLRPCGELSAGGRRVTALLAAGCLLAIGCSDGATLLWRHSGGTFTQQVLLAGPALPAPVAALSFSCDAALLAVATDGPAGPMAAAYHVPSGHQVMRYQALPAPPARLLWSSPSPELCALLSDGSQLSLGLPLPQLLELQALRPEPVKQQQSLQQQVQQQQSVQGSQQDAERLGRKVVRFAVAEPESSAHDLLSCAPQPGARGWVPQQQPIPAATSHPPSSLQSRSCSSMGAAGCRGDLPELPAHPLLRDVGGAINSTTISVQESSSHIVSTWDCHSSNLTSRADLGIFRSAVNPLFAGPLPAEPPSTAGTGRWKDAQPALHAVVGGCDVPPQPQPPLPQPRQPHRREPLYPILDLRALQGLPAAAPAAAGKVKVPQQPNAAAGRLMVPHQPSAAPPGEMIVPQVPPARAAVPAGAGVASEQPAGSASSVAERAATTQQPAGDCGAQPECLAEDRLAERAADATATAAAGQREQPEHHRTAPMSQQQQQQVCADGLEAPRQRLPPAPMQRLQNPPSYPDRPRQHQCNADGGTPSPAATTATAGGCAAACPGLADQRSPAVSDSSDTVDSGQASQPVRAAASATPDAVDGLAETGGTSSLQRSAADPQADTAPDPLLTAGSAFKAASTEAQQPQPGDSQPGGICPAAAWRQQRRSQLSRRCRAGSQQQRTALAAQLEEAEADAADAEPPQQRPQRPQQPQQQADNQLLECRAACNYQCKPRHPGEEQPSRSPVVAAAVPPAPAQLSLTSQAAASTPLGLPTGTAAAAAVEKWCAFAVGCDEQLSGDSDGEGEKVDVGGSHACSVRSQAGLAPTLDCGGGTAGGEEAPCPSSQPAAAPARPRLLTNLPAPVSLRCNSAEAGAAVASLQPAVLCASPDSSTTCLPLSAHSGNTLLPAAPAPQQPSAELKRGRSAPALPPAQVLAARRRATTAATTLPRSARLFSNLPALEPSQDQAAPKSSRKAALAAGARKQQDAQRAAQQQQQQQPCLEQLWTPPTERLWRQHQADVAAAPPLAPALPCGQQLVAQLLDFWPC